MSSATGPAPVPGTEPAPRSWILRALSRHQRGGPDALARFIEPGRGAFELSLALCALSLAFPWLAAGAMAAAARAWQRGAKRAWLALLAAGWCCLLGLAVRQYLGLGIFP